MVHLGLILLLLGQFATDKLSNESSLHLREGETRNYSESNREVELAVVDVTDPSVDKVVDRRHQAVGAAKNSPASGTAFHSESAKILRKFQP
jgi:hypothetical protein